MGLLCRVCGHLWGGSHTKKQIMMFTVKSDGGREGLSLICMSWTLFNEFAAFIFSQFVTTNHHTSFKHIYKIATHLLWLCYEAMWLFVKPYVPTTHRIWIERLTNVSDNGSTDQSQKWGSTRFHKCNLLLWNSFVAIF